MANTKITPHVLDSSLISGHSTVTAATNDFVLIQDVSDSNALKKALVSDLAQNEESPTFTGTVGIGASTDLGGTLNITHGNEFGISTSGSFNYQAKFESTDAEAAIVIEDSNSGTDYNRIGVIGNEMTFITNNSEAVRIDSDGSVGIGTTDPNAWASYTDSAATVLQVSDTSQRARIAINGGNGAHLDMVDHAGSSDDKHLNFSVDAGIGKFGSLNDAGNAFIKDNILVMDLGFGHVGLGTTTPDKKLVISDGGAQGIELSPAESGISRAFSYNRSSNAYSPLNIQGEYIQFSTGASSNTNYMTLQSDGKLAVTEISHISGGDLEIGNGDEKMIFNDDGYIQLQIADTERFYIDTTSNVPRFVFGQNTAGASNGPDFYASRTSPSAGQHTYTQFLESISNASAQGIKVGGLLASASYAFGTPDRGDILAQDNVSAQSFTDRTPYPTSLQLAKDVINSHQRRSEEEIERLATAQYNKIQNEELDMPDPDREAMSLEQYLTKYKKEYELDHSILHDYVNDTRYESDGIEGRDASATISCLVEVVKDLMQRIDTLEG